MKNTNKDTNKESNLKIKKNPNRHKKRRAN